ncbi:hypothetical protein [Algisphaera agarilytica]|uniref:Uncharacterized protein n=1 Tax=Algisphaera agarilytica TaxID=1385975 RepID=A0A7X0H392_9BACT|nr:hypothetical protein [Algisphaera agarilytica]MBB6428405.1 hypothetical protein [Algisphaera agarilytica]
MQQPSGSPANAQAVPRCVLLVGESSAVPSSLVGALDRRGLDIVIVRQPPRVMLELAVKPEPQDAPRDQPTPPTPDLSVVVVEPQQQPRVDELRAAIAAYYPAVRCWRYQAHGPEGRPLLDALDPPLEKPAEAPDPAIPSFDRTVTISTQDFVDSGANTNHNSEHDSSISAEPGRVKGARQRLRSLVVQVDDPQPQDQGPLVSEEELAMLLGPDPAPAPGNDPAGDPSADAQNKAKLGISPDSRHPDGERE